MSKVEEKLRARIQDKLGRLKKLQQETKSLNQTIGMMQDELRIICDAEFNDRFYVPKNLWDISVKYDLFILKPLIIDDEFNRWVDDMKRLKIRHYQTDRLMKIIPESNRFYIIIRNIGYKNVASFINKYKMTIFVSDENHSYLKSEFKRFDCEIA